MYNVLGRLTPVGVLRSRGIARFLVFALVIGISLALVPPAPGADASSGKPATTQDSGCAATPAPPAAKPPTNTVGALSVDDFAELLRDGAIDYAEAEGIGWIINLMGGGGSTSGKQIDDIQQSIAEANKKLDHISEQISYLCKSLEQLAGQLQTLTYWSNLQNASRNAQQFVDQMANIQDRVSVVENRKDGDGKPRTTLLDEDESALATLRSSPETTAWLRELADAVGGTSGVVAAYKLVIEDSMTHPTKRADGTTPDPVLPPSQTKLFTTQYMEPMAQMLEYYSRAMEQGLSALSDLYHADFVYNGTHYSSDDASVQKYVGIGLSAIDSWNGEVAGGLPSIPDNTVVDERSKPPYPMWTQTPVGISPDADPSAAKATAGCVDAHVVCFDNDYADDGTIMTTALLPATDTALGSQIAAEKYAGYDDWRVPTTDEYTVLTKDATGGLPVWAAKRGLTQFTPRAITSHAKGMDTAAKVVGPLLATRDGAPGALSADNPSRNALTFHAPAPAGQNEAGGAFVLVRSAAPVTLCTATWCPPQKGSNASTARFATTPLPEGQPALTRRPGKVATATLNEPTTYSTPTNCQQGPAYVVSPGANAVKVTTVGGAGGAGKLGGSANAAGGQGGAVTTVVPLPAGTTLHVQVGQDGGDTNGGTGGGANGGATVPASWPDAKSGDHSGGGGGASGVAADSACTLWLAVSGGGGGGGSGFHRGGTTTSGSWSGGRGGDACPLPGTAPQVHCTAAQSGNDSYPNNQLGTGGGNPPNNAGGHVRNSQSQSGGQGSTMHGGGGSDGCRSSCDGGAGGGGGAGYYGGGGGGGGGRDAAGGGGGGGADLAISGSDQTTYGFSAGQAPHVTITSVDLGDTLTAPAPATPPSTPRTPTSASLAATGPAHDTGWLVTFGCLAVVLGTVLLVAGRRRRS